MTAAVGDGRVSVWNTDTWELIHKLDHPSYIYRFNTSYKLDHPSYIYRFNRTFL